VIAVEVRSPKGFGRVRIRQIPDVPGASLVPFVCEVAETGSEILTDGWAGYNQLAKCGYGHDRVVLADTGDPAHISMPGVHRIAALVKRWILSTHQGSVSGKHLEYSLDEYTFRFNRRTSRSRGLLFYRLIEQAVKFHGYPFFALRGIVLSLTQTHALTYTPSSVLPSARLTCAPESTCRSPSG